MGVLRDARWAPISQSEVKSGPRVSLQMLVRISFVAFLAETSHQATLEFCLKQWGYLVNPIDSPCYTSGH